jgi:DNA repair protein RadC
MRCGLDAFSAHEVVDILLTFAIPRRDVKPLAKELIRRFGSLEGILDADGEALQLVEGLGPRCAIFLKLIREVAQAYWKQRMFAREESSTDCRRRLREYWSVHLAAESAECLEIAYLDHGFILQPDGIERLSQGDAHRVALLPRKILGGAIQRNCSAIVLCHNHPSGNVLPSEHDERFTKVVELTLKSIAVDLVDHLIVARGRAFSLKEQREME